MTPDGIMKRVLKGRLLDRYFDPQLVDLNMRAVMKEGIAPLLVSSDEPGVYRPDRELDGERSIVERIARRMNYQGAEAEQIIARAVDRFIRLGFILVNETDGSMELDTRGDAKAATELVTADTPVKTVSNRFNGLQNPGRQRSREPDDEYAARKKSHMAMFAAEVDKIPRKAGEPEIEWKRRVVMHFQQKKGVKPKPTETFVQPSLTLPLSGGLPPGAPSVHVDLAHELRGRFTQVGPSVTQTEPQKACQPLPNLGSYSASFSLPLAFTHAVAVVVSELDSNDTTATTTTRDAGASAGEPAENPNRQPNPVTQPDPNSPAISAKATALAKRAITKNSYNRHYAATAPATMQEYLNGGWQVAELEEAIDTAPGRVNAATYYIKTLPGIRQKRLQLSILSGSASSAETAAPSHPKFLAEWLELRAEDQAMILVFLKAMDQPTIAQQHKAMAPFLGRQDHLFQRVARKYPEIRQMAAYDPYDAKKRA